MRTAIRAIILFFIVLWLGGVLFFPVVAASAFGSLSDTHAAGTIVAKCLRILHYEGFFSGAIIVILLLIGQVVKAFPRPVIAPVVMTLIMLALTAYSQFSIIPRMENYRIAAGGAIDAVPPNNPNRISFNKLHGTSEHVEEGVLLAGIVLVVLLAWNYPLPDPRA
jgi:MFS superfamily sulfate permease-like transporter